MIKPTMSLMEIGGSLIKTGSLLLLQGLFALVGGVTLVIYVVVGSFLALGDGAFRKNLFESVLYTLKRWVGRG